MKTKFYLLAGLLFLSLTISSVKLCAQEIILPLTENEEIRPKSMSLSISTTTTATEYVYASYNCSFLTVYFTNFRGTAVVTIEDLKGNVLIEVSKSFRPTVQSYFL